MVFKSIQYKIVLASKSPRRQQLLNELGYEFEIRTKEVDEIIPAEFNKEKAAIYLSEKKAAAFIKELATNELLITSDTIVCLDDRILGKPSNKKEAAEMLQNLNNRNHEVITAISLTSTAKQKSFASTTKVFFKKLNQDEIDYYIGKYKPYDKAGAYGIQEWIGMIGIKKIEGSFYNVMGLPLFELYQELQDF